jgi:hypothetical protein
MTRRIGVAAACAVRAVVPPRAVLAMFGDEREQEIVVNPNMLTGRIALDEKVAAREMELPPAFRHLRTDHSPPGQGPGRPGRSLPLDVAS